MAIVGCVGAAALGVGVYARFLGAVAHPWTVAALVAGAGALVFALWRGDSPAYRVGAAGVATETGTRVERLLWCDVERVRLEKGHLVLSGAGQSLRLSLATAPSAAARAVAEAKRRIPKRVDVSDDAPLPALADGDGGGLVDVVGLTVAGRECAKSGQRIGGEADARLCPRCGQTYHRRHVPPACVTCGESLREGGARL